MMATTKSIKDSFFPGSIVLKVVNNHSLHVKTNPIAFKELYRH
jgi:hypothetical protein